MIKAQIVNVVATAALNQEGDFEEVRNFKEVFHSDHSKLRGVFLRAVDK